MAAPRERIFAALFERLQGVADFEIASRYLESIDDTAPTELPALYLLKGNETSKNVQGMPPVWALRAQAILYAGNNQISDEARVEPAAMPPSTQLNDLITAIESALEFQPADAAVPPPTPFANHPGGGAFTTTLGGLCLSCQISDVETFEGLIGGVSVAIVHIEMTTTA